MNSQRNHLLAERTQLLRLTEQLPKESVIERMSMEARVREIEEGLEVKNEAGGHLIATSNTGPDLAGQSIADQLAILQKFYSKLFDNMQDLPPEFDKLVDEHFWELM